MIKDKNISYKHLKEFLPITAFNTFEGASGASTDATSGTELGEWSDFGIVGLEQQSVGNRARCMFPVPSYWDTENAIHVRVFWTDAGEATATASYIVTYQGLTLGAAPGSLATLSESLDTAIAADAHCGIAHGPNATKWGTINANKISGDMLIVDVEMDAQGGGLNPLTLGIEWAYMPKFTDGPQHATADAPTDA